jgi:hypothetical protein
MDYEKFDLGIAFFKGKEPLNEYNRFTQNNRIRIILEKFKHWFIRFITRGQYSHCGIVYKENNTNEEWLFYSSYRKSGEYRIETKLNLDDWDIFPIELFLHNSKRLTKTDLIKYYKSDIHQNKKMSSARYCATFLNYPENWCYSPNKLANIVKMNKYDESK